MSMEQQLQHTAESWLAEETLSADRAAALEKLVRSRAARRLRFRWGVTAAAAAAAVVLVVGPVVTGLASNLPVVGPYMAKFAFFDRGANWANEQGYVLPVGKQVTADGYTFRVDGVLADAARTEVFWTIEGPDLSERLHFEASFGLAKEARVQATRSALVDGRLVGSTSLNPLPKERATVTLRLVEVGGVKGKWDVSFEASRAALDNLTRTLPVGQEIKGDGYALTVKELLLAPSETVVRVGGTGDRPLEILSAQLLADGVRVQEHADQSGWRGLPDGSGSGSWDLVFDRVEGEPIQLTLRLEQLGRVEPGGPSFDLTRPDAAAEADGIRMQVQSVETGGGHTKVTLAVSGGTHLHRRFYDWVLTGAGGKTYEHPSVSVPADNRSMVITFKGEAASPAKLAAGRTVRTIARDVQVTLPTK